MPGWGYMIIWFLVTIVFPFVPTSVFKIDYTELDNEGNDLIWISKNKYISFLFTYFLPYCAVPYAAVCDKVNGYGLFLMLIAIMLATFPLTVVMGTIGCLTIIALNMWDWFLNMFKREEEK